jgi:hypothetical protein
MKKHKQKFTPVRFSHLTSYASVGAVIRGAEDKIMAVTDTRYWKDKHKDISAEIIPYVTRITQVLQIDKELRMPPGAKEDDKGNASGPTIPAILFPRYAVCKRCGKLHNNPWKPQKTGFRDDLRCDTDECRGVLEQVTWCAVSTKGHMADVPWHEICHLNAKTRCEVDYKSNYLRLQTGNNGRKVIKCDRCSSQHFFQNLKELKRIHQSQPWIYGEVPILEEDDQIEILEVNNPGVYIPERVNALVIPPESTINKSSLVHKLYNNSKLCREIEKIKSPLRRRGKLREAANKYRTTVDKINEAMEEIKAGYPNMDDFIINDLYEDEYNAFLTPLENQKEDEDFITDHKSVEWKSSLDNDHSKVLSSIVCLIDKLVIANRLREIQIFRGFYRVSSEDRSCLVPPDILGESDWLPAIELFGEGLFFTLDEEILSKWECLESVRKRADEVLQRYEKSEIDFYEDIEITPRFILLHTLAHLLIRELETTAGYPAASLNERIYSTKADHMAGILVYTSVADIAGSLGGIVESAEPRTFLGIMDGVFKKAQWCSLDPVCTEQEGQGPGWLNRAACHACTLIPEPSCDYQNVFLDRVFIKGNTSLGIPGFLEFVTENSNKRNNKNG